MTLYPIRNKEYSDDVHESIIEMISHELPSLKKLVLSRNWRCTIDQLREVASTIQEQEYFS